MGQNIEQSHFTHQDHQAFQLCLHRDLSILEQKLKEPGWGEGPRSVGAELELYLTSNRGNPLLLNQRIQQESNDPNLTLELNRFNLEYNLDPVLFDSTSFSTIENQLTEKLVWLNQLCAKHSCHAIPIGILPTLTMDDLGQPAMTDLLRYHALTNSLQALRSGPFDIDINGHEPLRIQANDLTLEGANTSFQFHYRVSPNDFADTYNALQLSTPLVLAASGNSPVFLGNRLWQETRIALFKHSIDCRQPEKKGWKQPSRVNFGSGWIHNAYELFAASVGLHKPLMPIVPDRQQEQKKGCPSLGALRLHHGTVWTWNRAVFDPAGEGHLRIELRTLPAGPTPADMMANIALHIGLAEGLKPRIHQFMSQMPFKYAKYNFYRAAQDGLEAKLLWPDPWNYQVREVNARELLQELLPIALEGLQSVGIAKQEREHYIELIRQRLDNGQTGARWQLKQLEQLEPDYHSDASRRQHALHDLVSIYIENSLSGRPVSTWSTTS